MALLGRIATRVVGGRVEREDSGKILGHLTKERRGRSYVWRASASKFAFLGDGPFSGEPLGDVVPIRLYRPEDDGPYLPGEYRTQDDAITALQRYLARHHAPVMGYGAHPDVTRRLR